MTRRIGPRQRALIEYISENPGCTAGEAAKYVCGRTWEHKGRLTVLDLEKRGLVGPSGTLTAHGGRGLIAMEFASARERLAAEAEAAEAAR